MALPASAEWDTVTDRTILINVADNTLETRLELEDVNSWLDVINTRLEGMHTDLTQSEVILGDIRTSNQAQETTLTQIYNAVSGSSGPQEVEVVNFDEITVHIDDMEDLTSLLVDNTLNVPGGGYSVGRTARELYDITRTQLIPHLADISTKLDALGTNTDPGSGGGAGVVVPGNPNPGAMPVIAEPVLVPVDTRGPVDFYYNAPDVPEFEPGDDLEVGDFDFAPPTRTGLTNWTVNVPTGQLGAVFGMSGEDLTFSTDLAWYGGTLRTTVHGAIIAMAGLWASLFIFEEFRRYA